MKKNVLIFILTVFLSSLILERPAMAEDTLRLQQSPVIAGAIGREIQAKTSGEKLLGLLADAKHINANRAEIDDLIRQLRQPRPVLPIIVAAGKGTRYQDSLPDGIASHNKCVAIVDGRPVVQLVLDKILSLSDKEITLERPIVIISADNEAEIKQALSGYDVEYVLQNPVAGTGHAVLQVRNTQYKDFKGDLLVIWATMAVVRSETLEYAVKIQQSLPGCSMVFPAAWRKNPYAPLKVDGARVLDSEETHNEKAKPPEFGLDNVGVFVVRTQAALEVLASYDKNFDPAAGKYTGLPRQQTELGFPNVLGHVMPQNGRLVIAAPIADSRECQGIKNYEDTKISEEYIRQLSVAPEAHAASAGWNTAAPELVDGWHELTPSLKRANLLLLERYTTPKKVKANIASRSQSAALAIPETEKIQSISVLEYSDPGVVGLSAAEKRAERTGYIRVGANAWLLKRIGFIISAGAEASYLMADLFEKGLINDEEKVQLERFSVSISPDGSGLLEADLRVISYINKKFGVTMPVLIIGNTMNAKKIMEMLDKNGYFGIRNIAFAVQDNEAVLCEDKDKIAVGKQGLVMFNPNGGGGAVKAASGKIKVLNQGLLQNSRYTGFDWFEKNFQAQGVKDGSIVWLGADMEITYKHVFALANAGRTHDAVAVSYTIPKADINNTTGKHAVYRPGVIVMVKTIDSDSKEIEHLAVIEQQDIDSHPGLFKQMALTERKTNGFLLGNAGLYIFSLDLLRRNARNLAVRIRRAETVNPQLYVTDLVCRAQAPLILYGAETFLRPVKNSQRLRLKRSSRLAGAKKLLRAAGVTINGDPKISFCPAFAYALNNVRYQATHDRVYTVNDFEISGLVGVSFDEDGIRAYNLRTRLPASKKTRDPFMVFNGEPFMKVDYAPGTDIEKGIFVLPSLHIFPKIRRQPLSAFEKRKIRMAALALFEKDEISYRLPVLGKPVKIKVAPRPAKNGSWYHLYVIAPDDKHTLCQLYGGPITDETISTFCIDKIETAEEYRNLKVGSFVMRLTEAMAVEMGMARIILLARPYFSNDYYEPGDAEYLMERCRALRNFYETLGYRLLSENESWPVWNPAMPGGWSYQSGFYEGRWPTLVKELSATPMVQGAANVMLHPQPILTKDVRDAKNAGDMLDTCM